MSLDATALPFRPELRDHVVQCAIQWHLREILTIVAGRDRRAEPQLAALRRMLAQQCAQQRGLSRAIAPDDPQHAGPLQRPAEALDESARADAQAHVLRAHDLIAAALRHLEAHRHRSFRADHGAEPRQPLEPLAPALGLPGVLPRDVARNVVLLMRDDALLLIVCALLREPALGALSDKVGVTGRIRRGCATLEMQHVVPGRASGWAAVAP